MRSLRYLFITALLGMTNLLFGQYNMYMTNHEADSVIHGSYDPALYLPSTIINHPDSILNGIINDMSKDSLQALLEHIDTFYNRNSGSDTVSDTRGIGACRRWIYKKFQDYSAQNENRLLVSYLDFNQGICGQNSHRNVLAVLPGTDTTKKEWLLVEGHFDTRCEGACDTSCYSPGSEDNASGTVLVMELARIMSKYAFDRTIVFMTPTGEDQGLYGAKAFAKYVYAEGLDLLAVLNNDVIGGITCGATSSPPSCPYQDHVDSTHVRVFSYSQADDSASNSPSKQLARYCKMNQEEKINPLLETPMTINLIITEDREGRSGDHRPFRQRGYPAIRFCSQNEHGDGSGTPPDRQHTTTDVLGLDLTVPPDGVLDTFFVDMGYLSRNAISNGVNLGLLALSPRQPQPEFNPLPDGVEVTMTGTDTIYQHYRLGIRSEGSGTLYFDTVMTFEGVTQFSVTGLDPEKEYYFSVMNVEEGAGSLFSDEFTVVTVGMSDEMDKLYGCHIERIFPNPFGEQFTVEIRTEPGLEDRIIQVEVVDVMGRMIESRKAGKQEGRMEFRFQFPERQAGVLFCRLVVDGRALQVKKLIKL